VSEQAGMLAVPDTVMTVTPQTTYKEVYEAQFKEYKFPKQSLFEN